MPLMLLSLRAPEPLNTDNRFVAELLSVLDPVGFPPAASSPTLAPRLESLEGKTVFIIDCQMENSGVLLEQMQAWFRENLPGVHTPLVRWRGEIYAHEDRETLAEVGATGDAAIFGVGL
jgi:hypothetical protein